MTNGRPPLRAVLGTILAAPLFMGAVLIYVPYALTGWRRGPALFGFEGTRWIGVLLALLALPVLADFLVRFVAEGHGTPAPVAPPQRLVVGGMFRFVRNPAYLAAVTAIAGEGLYLASLAVLVYALGAWAFFHLMVVLYEEPTLRAKFGADYEAYCRRVPRWIPRRPR